MADFDIEAFVARNAHIPDDVIAKDIADTEAEIAGLRSTQEAEEQIARTHPNENERRMANFKAGARPQQIADREAFVEKLRAVQRARGTA